MIGRTAHEDELARDHGHRARYIEGLRMLASLLEYHPEIPLPDADSLAILLSEVTQ